MWVQIVAGLAVACILVFMVVLYSLCSMASRGRPMDNYTEEELDIPKNCTSCLHWKKAFTQDPCRLCMMHKEKFRNWEQAEREE